MTLCLSQQKLNFPKLTILFEAPTTSRLKPPPKKRKKKVLLCYFSLLCFSSVQSHLINFPFQRQCLQEDVVEENKSPFQSLHPLVSRLRPFCLVSYHQQPHHTYIYSTLSNKRTGMNYRIFRKNLDQGSVIIFDQ